VNAIRITRKIESETLTLPELKPFVGQEVEIVVTCVPRRPTTEAEWNAYFAEVGPDTQLDPEIYKRQREFDRLHANDHIV
jgi:hypothetical protein